MAKFLVLHTFDPRGSTSASMEGTTKAALKMYTKNTYCITTWVAAGAGKMACLWEAPSEQAIIDAWSKGPDVPMDGIYPATVIDWAEMKKMVR